MEIFSPDPFIAFYGEFGCDIVNYISREVQFRIYEKDIKYLFQLRDGRVLFVGGELMVLCLRSKSINVVCKLNKPMRNRCSISEFSNGKIVVFCGCDILILDKDLKNVKNVDSIGIHTRFGVACDNPKGCSDNPTPLVRASLKGCSDNSKGCSDNSKGCSDNSKGCSDNNSIIYSSYPYLIKYDVDNMVELIKIQPDHVPDSIVKFKNTLFVPSIQRIVQYDLNLKILRKIDIIDSVIKNPRIFSISVLSNKEDRARFFMIDSSSRNGIILSFDWKNYSEWDLSIVPLKGEGERPGITISGEYIEETDSIIFSGEKTTWIKYTDKQHPEVFLPRDAKIKKIEWCPVEKVEKLKNTLQDHINVSSDLCGVILRYICAY